MLPVAKTKANSKGMMPNGRSKGVASFAASPTAVFRHPDYTKLSPTAKALLWDLFSQFNGRNNGNLTLAENTMKRLGWSYSTVKRHKAELINSGWIAVTRYPRQKREPVLYRVTWLDADNWTGEPYLDPEAYNQQKRSLKC